MNCKVYLQGIFCLHVHYITFSQFCKCFCMFSCNKYSEYTSCIFARKMHRSCRRDAFSMVFGCKKGPKTGEANFFQKNRNFRLTSHHAFAIIALAVERLQTADGEWCNGSTCDSDSYCLGSNPSSPAFFFLAPLSRGLGRGPLKAATRVQIPLGSPLTKCTLVVLFLLMDNTLDLKP